MSIDDEKLTEQKGTAFEKYSKENNLAKHPAEMNKEEYYAFCEKELNVGIADNKHRFHPEDLPDFIDTINSYKPNKVLDFGCGANQYKNKIHNLVGIDKTPGPFVDHVGTYAKLRDVFESETFDIALVLSSVNTVKDIDETMQILYNWIKPNGYIVMRVRNDFDFVRSQNEYLKWDARTISDLSRKFHLGFHKPVQLVYETLEELSTVRLQSILRVRKPEGHRRHVLMNELDRRQRNIKTKTRTPINAHWVWWWVKHEEGDQLSFAKKRDLKQRSDELSYSKMTIEGKQKSFKDVQEQRKQLKGKRKRNLNEDINKG